MDYLIIWLSDSTNNVAIPANLNSDLSLIINVSFFLQFEKVFCPSAKIYKRGQRFIIDQIIKQIPFPL